MHNKRLLRNGTLELRPKRQPRYVNHYGYVLVKHSGHPNADKRGYLAEHTFAMAEAIGRPLLPNETVHHKNGVRADNRLSNLELWASAHPSGQRVEDLVRFAEEILALYGPVREQGAA